jgi:hypothetical protein
MGSVTTSNRETSSSVAREQIKRVWTRQEATVVATTTAAAAAAAAAAEAEMDDAGDRDCADDDDDDSIWPKSRANLQHLKRMHAEGKLLITTAQASANRRKAARLSSYPDVVDFQPTLDPSWPVRFSRPVGEEESAEPRFAAFKDKVSKFIQSALDGLEPRLVSVRYFRFCHVNGLQCRSQENGNKLAPMAAAMFDGEEFHGHIEVFIEATVSVRGDGPRDRSLREIPLACVW